MAIDLTSGLSDRREYVFAERPDTPEMRDAVNVWLEETRGAFGMRIGVEADMPDWDSHDVWLDIAFPDGRVISVRSTVTSSLAVPRSSANAGNRH